MNGNHVLVGALSALSLFVAGPAVAVEQNAPPHGPAKQMDKKMEGGMSCSGMMDVMGSGMMGGGMMPSMPPGNEKLNMQMHAEMMQAMGAIMQKYADKVALPQRK